MKNVLLRLSERHGRVRRTLTTCLSTTYMSTRVRYSCLQLEVQDAQDESDI